MCYVILSIINCSLYFFKAPLTSSFSDKTRRKAAYVRHTVALDLPVHTALGHQSALYSASREILRDIGAQFWNVRKPSSTSPTTASAWIPPDHKSSLPSSSLGSSVRAKTSSLLVKNKRYESVVPPNDFWNVQLDVKQPMLVRITLTVRRSSTLAVYGRRNVAPSITQYDFVQFIKGGRSSRARRDTLNGNFLPWDLSYYNQGTATPETEETLPADSDENSDPFLLPEEYWEEDNKADDDSAEVFYADYDDQLLPKVFENNNIFEGEVFGDEAPSESRQRRYADLLVVNTTLLHRMNTGLWYLAVYNDAFAPTQVVSMGKNKDISQDLRGRIVELRNEGLAYRKINAQICVPIASVGSIIRRWKCRDTTLSKPRTGRPRKINDHASRKLVRTVVQSPQTTREELKDNHKASGIEASKHTINRALRREGLRSRTPHRTPFLQKRHVKARLKFTCYSRRTVSYSQSVPATAPVTARACWGAVSASRAGSGTTALPACAQCCAAATANMAAACATATRAGKAGNATFQTQTAKCRNVAVEAFAGLAPAPVSLAGKGNTANMVVQCRHDFSLSSRVTVERRIS
ncbi:Transposase Tc1-like [Trinorchestia longiramus]|nr:Transposase Tc1-like [Trinorchestia longiramus]